MNSTYLILKKYEKSLKGHLSQSHITQMPKTNKAVKKTLEKGMQKCSD